MLNRIGTWFGLPKWQKTEDHGLPVFAMNASRPKSEIDAECYTLLKKIIEAVACSKVLNADKLWKQLCQLCDANDTSPAAILGHDVSRLTLLEEILGSRNSHLGWFFASRIPVGTYSQGRIQNTKEGLFTIRNNDRSGPAFCRIANGGLYTGGLRGDNFDGYGRISYAYGNIYEGQWDEGISLTASTWRAEKGTLAAFLCGPKKRLGGGPRSINDMFVEVPNAER